MHRDKDKPAAFVWNSNVYILEARYSLQYQPPPTGKQKKSANRKQRKANNNQEQNTQTLTLHNTQGMSVLHQWIISMKASQSTAANMKLNITINSHSRQVDPQESL